MSVNDAVADSKKLPISVQLVALTAALVFCVAVITVYSYARVLVQQWDAISQVPDRFSLLWTPGRSAILALLSAGTFVALLMAPASITRRLASVYLLILLLWICWQPAYWLIQGYSASAVFRRPDVLVKILYVVWIGFLAYLLNPTIISAIRRSS